jgi:hypothetical protein
LIGDASWTHAFSHAELIGIAAGPHGFVAIGSGGIGGPAVLHSANGRFWGNVTSDVFKHAVFRGIAAYRGGFAIVGRVGEQDTGSGGVARKGDGAPAAWWSPDGTSWTRAIVPGASGPGAELSWVLGGSSGLFAEGPNLDKGAVGAAGWRSSDGLRWSRIGQVTREIPYGTQQTADGERIFVLGPQLVNGSYKENSLAAWASPDGRSWTSINLSGDAGMIPSAMTGTPGKPFVDRAFALSAGLVVIGQQDQRMLAWYAAYSFAPP